MERQFPFDADPTILQCSSHFSAEELAPLRVDLAVKDDAQALVGTSCEPQPQGINPLFPELLGGHNLGVQAVQV